MIGNEWISQGVILTKSELWDLSWLICCSIGGGVLLVVGLYSVLWGKDKEDRKSEESEQKQESKEEVVWECIISRWGWDCSKFDWMNKRHSHDECLSWTHIWLKQESSLFVTINRGLKFPFIFFFLSKFVLQKLNVYRLCLC